MFVEPNALHVRRILALLLLVCFAGVQSASAITEQTHHHGPSHADCCSICHAGHAWVVPAAQGFTLSSPLSLQWNRASDSSPIVSEYLIDFHLSRGPPALVSLPL